jgi:ribonuclease HI
VSDRAPLVAVYADESCLGNGQAGDTPGGAGALIEWQRPDGVVQRYDWWIAEANTTNNRMALRSVIDPLVLLARKGNRLDVVFTTDSRYVVDGMTSWVHGWMARGWRRKAGAVENLELWQAAVESASRHVVEWRWVRGHQGHPQNEYANHLATRAAATQEQSSGLVASTFEAWWGEVESRGRSTRAIAPFPPRDSFRPAASLRHELAGRRLE